MKKPLEGVRIADFSWVFAGPLTTKILADYGAAVIKIEGKTRIDGERGRHPYKDHIPGVNRALDFNQNNTSKMSFALNLAHPKGIEIVKKLVKWSDIVIENFAGGVMERLGLDYEELKKVKPDIIMLSACMQGQTGPHALHPGYGHQLTALAGYHHIVGWPDRRPQHFQVYTDWITPYFTILAMLSALDYHRHTGKGQYFDMSQYETSVQFISHLMLDYHVNGRVALRNGNRCDYAAPHGAYRCRGGEDRWCAIAVFSDEEWQSFCRVLGNPQWTKELRFATPLARKQNEDELDKLVEAWTVNYLAEEAMVMMQAARVSAGLVENQEDSLDKDAQLKYAGFYQMVNHPEIGNYHSPRPSFLMSRTGFEVRSAPLLGEHNEYICKQILGMSDDEIAELVIAGVIE